MNITPLADLILLGWKITTIGFFLGFGATFGIVAAIRILRSANKK